MWDERYNVEHYVYGTDPNQFLEQNIDRLPQGEVLCLAEGEGRNAVFLARRGYQVTAVDASAVGLAKAERLAAEHRVRIGTIRTDLADYDLGDERWDAVVSIFAHVPPPIRARLHGQMRQALKPGGVLLLEAYTPAQIGRGTGGPSAPEMMMSATQLREELTGLHFQHLQELERDVVEGEFHTGRASVVQLIAERPR